MVKIGRVNFYFGRVFFFSAIKWLLIIPHIVNDSSRSIIAETVRDPINVSKNAFSRCTIIIFEVGFHGWIVPRACPSCSRVSPCLYTAWSDELKAPGKRMCTTGSDGCACAGQCKTSCIILHDVSFYLCRLESDGQYVITRVYLTALKIKQQCLWRLTSPTEASFLSFLQEEGDSRDLPPLVLTVMGSLFTNQFAASKPGAHTYLLEILSLQRLYYLLTLILKKWLLNSTNISL